MMVNLTKLLTFENVTLEHKGNVQYIGCSFNIWLQHCTIEVRVYTLRLTLKYCVNDLDTQ